MNEKQKLSGLGEYFVEMLFIGADGVCVIS